MASSTRNVILIGSTGNGKSTMGNFLVIKDLKLVEDVGASAIREVFKRGTKASRSQTKKIQTETVGHLDATIIVADTPGLDDSKGSEADVHHTIQIGKALQELRRIHKVLIVHNMGTKMSAVYKATLRFYVKLLSAGFRETEDKSKIFAILINGMSETKSAEETRENVGTSIAETCKIIQEGIVKALGISGIKYYCLNAMPNKEEMSIQLLHRKEILDVIYNSIPIDVSVLLVPKPQLVLDDCKTAIGRIRAEIDGFQEALENEPILMKMREMGHAYEHQEDSKLETKVLEQKHSETILNLQSYVEALTNHKKAELFMEQIKKVYEQTRRLVDPMISLKDLETYYKTIA